MRTAVSTDLALCGQYIFLGRVGRQDGYAFPKKIDLADVQWAARLAPAGDWRLDLENSGSALSLEQPKRVFCSGRDHYLRGGLRSMAESSNQRKDFNL